jgi:P4 family phage/plasmid primase-like protien
MRSIITKSYDLPILTGSPDSRYINTTTGMLDWSTGELLEHNIAYLSTVQLPVPYDTAATCPAFDAWLAEVIPPENMDLAWEIIGYMVMSGNPLHQAVLLHGDGGNGKSTFLRVLVALLGKHNTSSVTLRNISEGKFETAGLFGKIANVAGDIDSKYLGDTSTFKAITGSDIIETQHKYGHPFTFVPWAVPIFSANETWRSSDTTEGYFRRWTTLPFPNKVIGKHGAVFDESALFMETPGILVKAVASLRVLMARGSFEMLGMAADLKREFEHESDVVQVWLREDERVIRHDAGNTTDRTERPLLYRRYADWSKDNGHTALNSTNFYKRLTRIGFLATRGANARYILGIHLDIFSAHLDMANAFATPEASAD